MSKRTHTESEVISLELAAHICELLGLDPSKTAKITIEAGFHYENDYTNEVCIIVKSKQLNTMKQEEK